MKLGIRYCGGCNSRYDRVKFKNKLVEVLEDYKAIKVMFVKETNQYDLIVVINGCSVACGNKLSELNMKSKFTSIEVNHTNMNVNNILKEILLVYDNLV